MTQVKPAYLSNYAGFVYGSHGPVQAYAPAIFDDGWYTHNKIEVTCMIILYTHIKIEVMSDYVYHSIIYASIFVCI